MVSEMRELLIGVAIVGVIGAVVSMVNERDVVRERLPIVSVLVASTP